MTQLKVMLPEDVFITIFCRHGSKCHSVSPYTSCVPAHICRWRRPPELSSQLKISFGYNLHNNNVHRSCLNCIVYVLPMQASKIVRSSPLLNLDPKALDWANTIGSKKTLSRALNTLVGVPPHDFISSI